MKNIVNGWSRSALENSARAVHDYMSKITILQAKRALITINPQELVKNPYAMHDIVRLAFTK